MEKKNLDWGNLGFGYMTTDYRYVANYKDGKWDDGALVTDPTVTLNECAGVFQYSQSCFEGLKAYTTPFRSRMVRTQPPTETVWPESASLSAKIFAIFV